MNERAASRLDAHRVDAAIPGAAIARVCAGAISIETFGVSDIRTGKAISEAIIFDAASLSKPVTAFMALQLVDQGLLNLDAPLASLIRTKVPAPLAGSPINAWHVLTQTSGLPNLQGVEPLKTYFGAGSRYSYSGIGFAHL